MYKNVGKSIKTLVNILVCFGMIIWALVGILALAVCALRGGVLSIILGVLALLAAGLMAFLTWVSGFVMYAYGEITENTTRMVNAQGQTIKTLERILTQMQTPPVPPAPAAPITPVAPATVPPAPPAPPAEPEVPVQSQVPEAPSQSEEA